MTPRDPARSFPRDLTVPYLRPGEAVHARIVSVKAHLMGESDETLRAHRRLRPGR